MNHFFTQFEIFCIRNIAMKPPVVRREGLKNKQNFSKHCLLLHFNRKKLEDEKKEHPLAFF